MWKELTKENYIEGLYTSRNNSFALAPFKTITRCWMRAKQAERTAWKVASELRTR